MSALDKADDLVTRIKQADSKIQSWVGKDVYDYFKLTFNSSAVKVVAPALGNLTAEQIAQGMRGAPPPLAASQSPAGSLQNSLSASQIVGGQKLSTWLILGVAGIGAFLFLSKKRRG